ncbi:phosphatidylinositol transfer protein 3-like [Impatiens glandulifera]|uniref:phosphatidylinositol transfer protein 3-like n=1 Tax=Impatiens glandulifera TaxID=253017 RepID=UPI001FB0683F|nr:phosphatidylinositol transfer protein 3-like [Impatiens glandulifera]
MTDSAKKPPSNGDDTSCRTEEQQQKVLSIQILFTFNKIDRIPYDFNSILFQINEVLALISPIPDKLAAKHYSNESISRYLISQKWNVQKASKMMNESFKWRLQYKPEEIRWEHIAYEAELGKIYRLNFEDKQGRTVLVMRPRFQNSKSIESQMKYLVYCMEKAIMNREEMIWLVDFNGFTASNISLKLARRTTYILQNYYPQRLATAILYDPPNIFEPFWKVT